MMKYQKHLGYTQQEQAPGTVQNNAGGYSFAISPWQQLDRFLILGTEGGTYYVDERKLTKDNVESLKFCTNEDAQRVVDRIVGVSHEGLAPKNDPAIFALAYVASYADVAGRQYALSHLNAVCRIGTHLFHFLDYVTSMRGWGRALKRAVANWYLGRNVDDLAYQLAKYKQRDGWSHADALRLAKPKVNNEAVQNCFAYATGKPYEASGILEAEVLLKANPTLETLKGVGSVPREILPTEMLNNPEVWKHLVMEGMPLTALVRNLGKMSSLGVFEDNAVRSKVVKTLGDAEYIHKSRLHPLAILMAAKVYSARRGVRGSLTWTPDNKIMQALDKAFYLAFKNVEPTGKNILIGLDVSGSMGGFHVSPELSPREKAAAMCLVTEAIEDNARIMAFTDRFVDAGIHSGMSLSDVVEHTSSMPFGGTDCSLPMLYALQKKLDVDTFIVYTDSETWAGAMHPDAALREYRKKMNKPNAQLIVVGMESNGFSIADPKDANMLDVVGFDASAPQVMSMFMRQNDD